MDEALDRSKSSLELVRGMFAAHWPSPTPSADARSNKHTHAAHSQRLLSSSTRTTARETRGASSPGSRHKGKKTDEKELRACRSEHSGASKNCAPLATEADSPRATTSMLNRQSPPWWKHLFVCRCAGTGLLKQVSVGVSKAGQGLEEAYKYEEKRKKERLRSSGRGEGFL